MIRRLLFLFLLLASGLLTNGLIAQQQFPNPVQFGTSLPATCTPGQPNPLFWLLNGGLTTGTLYECTAVNTWTTGGGGSSFTCDTTSAGKILTASGTANTCAAVTALPNGTTATTQSANDNSTKVATTAYADAAVAAGVTTARLRRVCSIVVGADNGAVLVNADLGPQKKQCKVPYAATIVELDVAADAGTPSVIPAVRHCSVFTTGVCSTETVSNIVSGALSAAATNFDACSNTGGTTGLDGGTTCTNTLQNTSIAIGDYLELVSGTAGGTAKRMTVSVIYTVN